MFDVYKKKKILITGHTGFKGSWLYLWLQMLGAEVYGYALSPDSQSHYSLLSSKEIIPQNGYDGCNILNKELLQKAIEDLKPDLIFHLAAQAIVNKSRENPSDTFNTNIMGMVNLLDVCKDKEHIKGIVNIVTDKVYHNDKDVGYKENDPLCTGSQDPYSASKVCVEIVSHAYRDLIKFPIVNVRAGNVIGGGDWSKDRIIPDIVRSIVDGVPLKIRSLRGIRPWQHVLDVLSGYIRVGELILRNRRDLPLDINFGPPLSECIPVSEIIVRMESYWKPLQRIEVFSGDKDSSSLKLDSSLAFKSLSWKTKLTTEKALEFTASWYKAFYEENKILSEDQITTYMKNMWW